MPDLQPGYNLIRRARQGSHSAARKLREAGMAEEETGKGRNNV
jgi:hypothetical protein